MRDPRKREQNLKSQIKALEKQLFESFDSLRELSQINELLQVRNGELSEGLSLLRLEVEGLRKRLSWEG